MNRKQRDSNRATAEWLRRLVERTALCVNCGEPGPHFAPPSGGVGGVFICTAKVEGPTGG